MGHKSKSVIGAALNDPEEFYAGESALRPARETLTPEDFLERARNADRILENCRKKS